MQSGWLRRSSNGVDQFDGQGKPELEKDCRVIFKTVSSRQILEDDFSSRVIHPGLTIN